MTITVQQNDNIQSMTQQNANYIVFYNGKQHDIIAPSKLAAFNEAVTYFKVPKSKRGLMAVEFHSYAWPI